MPVRHTRRVTAFVGLLVLTSPLTTGAATLSQKNGGLPLGLSGLPETRTTRTIAEGVALTTIVRGRVSPDDHWTVDVAIPTGEVPPTMDPDTPAAVLGSKQNADAIAAKLTSAGYTPSVVEETNPAYRDLPAGTLGWVVRVGSYADPAAAGTAAAKLKTLGFKTSTVFTGGDQTQTDGPWVMNELTIDPHKFKGSVEENHGSSQTGRRTTTQLAAETGALAAVNGGFFVINPADGVPGQSAGMVVEHGRVLRDSTNGRIVAILRDGGKHVEFAQLTTEMTLHYGDDATHRVSGLNRPAGVIRDCGGHPGDQPTSAPLHDVTCTNPNETVFLTPEFGAAPPAGPGVQAVVDADGTVASVGPRDGKPVPTGSSVIQSIGTEAGWLSGLAVGQEVELETKIRDAHGHPVHFGDNDSVVNGGPDLLLHGGQDIRPVADGIAHPGDPSFLYGWAVRRNPRTAIGTDDHGRVVLFEADGRLPGYSQGLSLDEEAQVLRSLGVADAMNLDGGGSSAMAIGSTLVGKPSDPSGERPVGDAVVVLPTADKD